MTPVKAWALGSALLGSALLGCASRATPTQCEAMVEHVIGLIEGSHEGRAAKIAVEVADARREALLDRCLRAGTAAEVACVAKAETVEGIQACAP